MVVAEGDTATPPLVATVPMPLLIWAEVAPEELQLRVALWPWMIAAGFAPMEAVGAEGDEATVMVSDCLNTVPELSHACTVRWWVPTDAVTGVFRVFVFTE